jgi:2-dehydropantoate 2-reductase
MANAGLRVAVLGPGGVGGLLAALLARAGDSVLVIAGDETARSIGQGGLRLESRSFGNFNVPVRAATQLAEPIDAIFVTVKSNQLSEGIQRVPAGALGEALVIPLLNGLDHVDLLRTVYPASSVVAATIRVETARVRPGLIRHTSPFAAVDIAPAAVNRERVTRVARHLEAAGFEIRIREDEAAMLWEKFAFLAPMALLTTHQRGNAGVVRTRRREDAIAVVSEVAAVARAEGFAADPVAAMRMLDSLPESMETSMQRDQEAGRPLELEAIGQSLLRRAARAGVDVPVTSRLVEELRSRTAGVAG